MKILIIQDDQSTYNDISQAFHICLPDAELICSNTGIEGFKLVKKVGVDLVILDLGISDFSIFDLLTGIRRETMAPIVVMSTSDREANIVKCLECGADEYIIKPFRQLEFMAHIRALLKREGALRYSQNIDTMKKEVELKKHKIKVPR
jgi:DNA-binding response OmpR family regulator